MSNVQQTSLDAFESVQDSLGEEQLRMLSIFRHYPDHRFTDEELATRLSKEINTVTPRRGELEKSGYIIRCDKIDVIRNGIKRSVFTWKLNIQL